MNLIDTSRRAASAAAVVICASAAPKNQKYDDAKDQKRSDGGYDAHSEPPCAVINAGRVSHDPAGFGNRALSALAIRSAVVGKAVVAVSAASDVVPQLAVLHDIDREAHKCCEQRENDDNGVEHFFASCDALEINLSQVDWSPK